jgi:penicillin amidase
MLRIILTVVVALTVSLTIGGHYWIVERPMPQIQGQLALRGLQARVEVIRDQWGVPHLFAQTEEDLFMVQGFVTAQDRLWQMDLSRRAGHGRLAEIFGPVALRADQAVRTLGLHRFAKETAQKLSPRARRVAEAYARGVNAFIASQPEKLPLEFSLLGYRPEPWTVEDSLAVTATMAQTLHDYFYTQISRAKVYQILGAKAQEIDIAFSTEGTFLIDAPGHGVIATAQSPVSPWLAPTPLQAPTLEALEAFAQDYRALALFILEDAPELGSNNWVVHGMLTDTGKPYLVNDPHLAHRQPATWYEIHLSGAGWNVTGAVIPGIPGVTIGHNDRIAWGITNAYAAIQDLFIEKFNPQNPTQYEFLGRWEEAKVVREEIFIKGERTPIVHETLITRHGPVITELAGDYGERVALSWSFIAGERGLDGLLDINHAGNWEEFRRAVSQWNFDLNFVYADVEGHIGYQLSGLIPRRPNGYAGVPVPGWTGEHEWDGFVPFEQMPYALDPETRFIATANHRTVSRDYRPEVPGEWTSPFRARRIVQMLQSKSQHSREDMRAMLADSYNEAYHQTAKLLVERVEPQMLTDRELRALGRLVFWDGIVTESDVAGSIVHETVQALVEQIFQKKLDSAAGFIGFSRGLYLLLKMAQTDPQSDWFDDPATAEREELSAVLVLGFKTAIARLTMAHSSDLSQWNWGRVYEQRFPHALGRIGPLGSIVNRRSPTAGGRITVNRDLASYRLIIDLADLDQSRSGLTTGQSGHPFAKHYSDQLSAWRAVQPHRMLWERGSIEQHREGLLMMVPDTKHPTPPR